MLLLKDLYGVIITLCLLCITHFVLETKAIFLTALLVHMIQFQVVATKILCSLVIDITTTTTMMSPPLCVSQVIAIIAFNNYSIVTGDDCIQMTFNRLIVKMGIFVLLVNLSIEGGWKSVKIMFGGQYVLHMDFLPMMQMLSVEFLDTKHLVCFVLLTKCTSIVCTFKLTDVYRKFCV